MLDAAASLGGLLSVANHLLYLKAREIKMIKQVPLVLGAAIAACSLDRLDVTYWLRGGRGGA